MSISHTVHGLWVLVEGMPCVHITYSAWPLGLGRRHVSRRAHQKTEIEEDNKPLHHIISPHHTSN